MYSGHTGSLQKELVKLLFTSSCVSIVVRATSLGIMLWSMQMSCDPKCGHEEKSPGPRVIMKQVFRSGRNLVVQWWS